MPTSKPRITITLEPAQHEVLTRLSRATGQPMASFVSTLLQAAERPLVRMVVVMERAAAASQEVRAGLTAAVERAERELVPDVEQALGQSDLFLADREYSIGATVSHAWRAKPAGASKSKKNPRPVTRG